MPQYQPLSICIFEVGGHLFGSSYYKETDLICMILNVFDSLPKCLKQLGLHLAWLQLRAYPLVHGLTLKCRAGNWLYRLNCSYPVLEFLGSSSTSTSLAWLKYSDPCCPQRRPRALDPGCLGIWSEPEDGRLALFLPFSSVS